MLDFDGDVISERREVLLHPLDDAHAVGRAVEEIRIAEGDMLRPGLHLLADVGQHNVSRNHSERPVVNGHNGTMTAEVLAATARLRISGDAIRLAIEQGGVSAERRQSRPGRYLKSHPFERDP